MSYTHSFNSQRFGNYEFLKYSTEIEKERGALCIYLAMKLNVQPQIRRSTLKQVVRRLLHLLGYIF